jgi:hypothetical protein
VSGIKMLNENECHAMASWKRRDKVSTGIEAAR